MENMEEKLDQLKDEYRQIEAPEFIASRISVIVREETTTNRAIYQHHFPAFTLCLVLLVFLALPGLIKDPFVETSKKLIFFTKSKPKTFGFSMDSIPSLRISKLDKVPTSQWGRKTSAFRNPN